MRIVFGEVITGGTHVRVKWVAEGRALVQRNGCLTISCRIHPLIPVGGSGAVLIVGAFTGTWIPFFVYPLPVLISFLVAAWVTVTAVDEEEDRARPPLPPDEPADEPPDEPPDEPADEPPDEPTGAKLIGPGGEQVPCALIRDDDENGMAVWMAVPLEPPPGPVTAAVGWILHLDYKPARTMIRLGLTESADLDDTGEDTTR